MHPLLPKDNRGFLDFFLWIGVRNCILAPSDFADRCRRCIRVLYTFMWHINKKNPTYCPNFFFSRYCWSDALGILQPWFFFWFLGRFCCIFLFCRFCYAGVFHWVVPTLSGCMYHISWVYCTCFWEFFRLFRWIFFRFNVYTVCLSLYKAEN